PAIHAGVPGVAAARTIVGQDTGRGQPLSPRGTRLMGTLTVPSSGLVCIDTMTLIYTVERYPAYWPILQPLWQAAQAGSIEIVSSELTILEALVGPLKSGDSKLVQDSHRQRLGAGNQNGGYQPLRDGLQSQGG